MKDKKCIDCNLPVKYGKRCKRCANLGKNNPMYGKTYKKPGAHIGISNPMYGKHHSNTSKQKMRMKKIGKKLTHNHIENIRKGHIGLCLPEIVKQKIGAANKGRKHSIASKRKMCQNHADFCGSKNPQWIGGKSFEPYSKEFNKKLKNKIYNRDKFNCALCNDTQRQLQVHHIDYNKKNNTMNNLLTLCARCHSKTNYNRKLWSQRLYKLIKGGVK